MRNFLVVFILCGFVIVAQTQTPERPANVYWSDEYNIPTGSHLDKIVTPDGDGFIAARIKSSRFFNAPAVMIERYDSKPNLVKSSKIDLKFKKKRTVYEDVLMVDKKLYLFTSFNNRGKGKNYLFAQQIDKQKLTVTGKLMMIAEVDARIADIGSFGFTLSRDSTKLLVCAEQPNRRSTNEGFTISVFDGDMKLQWSKPVRLPYEDDRYRIAEYRLDNDGNVYMLGIASERPSLFRFMRSDPNYEYQILAYRGNGIDTATYRINSGDKFITNLTARIDGKGHLVCTGFYSDKGTFSIKGTYFCRLDPVGRNIYNEHSEAFDYDFVTANYSRLGKSIADWAIKNNDARREPELYRYKLDQLILRSDGGALLVAEQFYIVTNTYTDFNGRTITDYTYYYNDVIVVNISPDGNIEWASRVPKRQVTRNDGGYYSSYTHCVAGDRIYVAFNDSPSNFTKTRRTPRSYSAFSAIVTVAEIAQDGSVLMHNLFSNRDNDTLIRPKAGLQTGRKELMLYGERRRQFRWAAVRF